MVLNCSCGGRALRIAVVITALILYYYWQAAQARSRTTETGAGHIAGDITIINPGTAFLDYQVLVPLSNLSFPEGSQEN